jgi:transposase
MTKTNKRTFTQEFKREAANLVVTEKYTVAEACKAMDVSSSAMWKWVKQLKQEKSGITPTAKALTSEQQEIQVLRARIKRLEMEKDILKKATALLGTDLLTNASI